MFLPFISIFLLEVAGVRLTVIKPVPETVEAIFYKVFCCSKIEPRINCRRALEVRADCEQQSQNGAANATGERKGAEPTFVYYAFES